MNADQALPSEASKQFKKAIRSLSKAAAYLVSTSEGELARMQAAAEIVKAAQAMERQIRIPVYRHLQASRTSPCELAGSLGIKPCEVCVVHQQCRRYPANACKPCRRGKPPLCLKAVQAPAAFTVDIGEAIAMVKSGFASFEKTNRGIGAVRLTFSTLAGIRGNSLRIDQRVLLGYAQGERWAVAIIDGHNGWADNADGLAPRFSCPVDPHEPVYGWAR